MQADRRQLLLGLGAVLGTPLAFAGPAAVPRRGLRPSGRRRLTALTAPDAASRQALAGRLVSPLAGASAHGNVGPAISRNFSQIVAQNFAAQDTARLVAWLDQMSAFDLASLGQRYANSLASSGQPALALDILAHRLDARHLARLSPSFGFGPLAAAVNKVAPERYSEFAQWAPKVQGPVPFAEGIPASLPGAGQSAARGNPNYLDMSIEDIYLSFRTTPFVGMSVSASIYSTGSIVGGHLAASWGVGWTIGTFMSWGLQRFTPDLWDSMVDGLGGWLYEWLEDLHGPSSSEPIRSPEEINGIHMRRGFLEKLLIDDRYHDFYALAGGEFGETRDWVMHVPYSPIDGTCPDPSGCQLIDNW